MTETEFKEKLKYKCGCGWCPELLIIEDLFDVSKEKKYQCRCFECNIETRQCKTPIGAIKAWNRMPERGWKFIKIERGN